MAFLTSPIYRNIFTLPAMDDGGLYVAGYYRGNQTFGYGDTDQVVLSGTSTDYDVFLARYDWNDGTLDWATRGQSGNADFGMDVAATPNGQEVFITGDYAGTLHLNHGVSTGTLSTNAGLDTVTVNGGNGDIFVAKFDATDGSVVWARSVGGGSYEYAGGVAVDLSDNGVIIGGRFRSTAYFGGVTLNASGGLYNGFVAKYSNGGGFEWVRQITSEIDTFDQAQQLRNFGIGSFPAPAGGAVVTGAFAGTANFDGPSLTSQGGPIDSFVARYSTDGTCVWARRQGSGNLDYAGDVCVTGTGRVVATGEFNSEAHFDGLTLTESGSNGMWIASFFSGLPFIDPVIPDSPDIFEGTSYTLDLTQYENDLDTSDPAQLNWSVTPMDTAEMTAEVIDGDTLEVTPKNYLTDTIETLTLTLTDGQGNTVSQDVDVTLIEVPPMPPTNLLKIPNGAPVEVDDLVCVVAGASVANGLDVEYIYEWSNGTDTITHGPMPDFADVLLDPDDADIVAGEVWTCRVRTYDGVRTSGLSNPATFGTVTGLASSVLELTASASSLTLGDTIMLAGSITPDVNSVQVLFDDTTPPSFANTAQPNNLVTLADSTFAQDFMPNEAGAWAIDAKWLGNGSVLGDHDAVVLSVDKAPTTVTWDEVSPLSVTSAPLPFANLTAKVWLGADNLTGTSLEDKLEGVQVALLIRDPQQQSAGPVVVTTDADGLATFTPADFADAGVFFDQPGTWDFKAEFNADHDWVFSAGDWALDTFSEGNRNLHGDVTDEDYGDEDAPSLIIRDGAGYAVLVTGRLDATGEGLAEHQKTMDLVYRSFHRRGFGPDDIYYLREAGPRPPASGVVVDGAPTKANIQSAITQWARARQNEQAGPVYIVMVDHGGEEEAGLDTRFFAYSGQYGAARYITPGELNGYLNALQNPAGLDLDAQDEDTVVIIGSCYSGGFIDGISGPRRIIATSAAADQESTRGPEGADNVADGEIFVTQLFGQLSKGKRLKEAFERTSAQVFDYTTPRTNGTQVAGERPQEPLLDDNGDGIGSLGRNLSAEPGDDGGRAHEIELGFGVTNSDDSVSWAEARETVSLDADLDVEVGTLWALATQAPSDAHEVYIIVKTPLFSGLAPVDDAPTGHAEDPRQLQQEIGVEVISPDTLEPGDDRYNWSSLGALFDTPGTYRVYYFITDGETGETASHLATTVFRADPDNAPPPPVNLLYPDNDAETGVRAFLAWSGSADPNGDAVSYRVELSTNEAFSGELIVLDHLPTTYANVTALVHPLTYYWHVIAKDEFGAFLPADEYRSFTVNQGNTDTVGPVPVNVRKLGTTIKLEGAAVTLKQGIQVRASELTGSTGDAVLTVDNIGTYTLVVSLDGYFDSDPIDIDVDAANDLVEVELESLTDDFRWGDVNADGVAGMLDAVAIVKYYDNEFANPFVHPRGVEAAELDGKPTANPTINVADAIEIVKKRIRLIAHFAVDTLEPWDFGPEGGKRFGGVDGLDGRDGLVVGRGALKGAGKSALIAAPRTLSVARAVGGEAGVIVEVPVTIDDAAGVEGAVIELNYDPAALEFVAAVPGEVSAAWELFAANGAETGTATVAGGGTATSEGPGALAVFRFKVQAGSPHHKGGGLGGVSLGEETELNDGEIGYVVTK